MLSVEEMAINRLECGNTAHSKNADYIQLAIKALKKQVPQKIKHNGCFDNDGVFHTWNGVNGVPYDLCPNCEKNLCTDGVFGRNKKNMFYCEKCGQALDWSE